MVQRAAQAREALARCELCPRACGVNRLDNQRGFCHTGRWATVASATPHFGEEPGISGVRGSGTVFFGRCNLACSFCQNHPISQPDASAEDFPEADATRLADLMLRLQDQGCHNINWVSPGHVTAQCVEALVLARQQGLTLPVVYNSNGYDGLESLALLDGLVDVYLPDFKAMNPQECRRLWGAQDYPPRAMEALTEMHRQVGDPVEDADGMVVSGLVVRHLVLPNDLSDTREVLTWIARNLGAGVYVSLMAQYFPTHRALEDPLLSRGVSEAEYARALATLDRLGFAGGWRQEPSAAQYYRPDFSCLKKPFADIDDFVDPGRK